MSSASELDVSVPEDVVYFFSSSGNIEVLHVEMRRGDQTAPDMGKKSLKTEVDKHLCLSSPAERGP